LGHDRKLANLSTHGFGGFSGEAVVEMRNARRSIIPVMSLDGGDDSCTGMWWVGEGIERGRYQATKATSTASATMPRMASLWMQGSKLVMWRRMVTLGSSAPGLSP
jgi:hypothetical protein